MQDAGKIILKDLDILIETLKEKAKDNKETICIGRSHGIHAEPMTFGVKVCGWIDLIERNKRNFEKALDEARIGQISGPVGTYSNIDPEIEKQTCEILGLKPAKFSTQVIARDIHAQYLQSLALIASVVEQIAVELRHLQRTEVLEVEEGFSKGQKGSSAMPHKKNPISGENLSGLARVVRSNSITAMENIALWHERDISHSSAERIIFPDSTILVDYMLNRLSNTIENLVVHKDNMLKKIRETYNNKEYTTEGYQKDKSQKQSEIKRYQGVAGMNANFVETDTEFTAQLDFSLADVQASTLSTLQVYRFFKYHEQARVVAYEMPAMGYTCS
jgi:adenylosuccinate lyase